ncbi:hypothetical protein GJR96_02350 [Haloferax sp. MBLA0076]|uniref:Chemotaxis protein CheA n=1 Tax=Haloferax litoreum TaxID=2666140 RepID=A0A6A8GCK3_9EURY|nr:MULTISPECIES: chemotaxis protein CheA [Haloferax]KAB1192343.1 hypothetical protein Hfx1148_02335 [Haloferax sp. CBA1148]MRX20805.1 hypothetical protein [Haloferax litoreum]
MSRNDEFVRETRASVRQLTNGLVELERDGGSRELVDDLFRTAHTLKGNCGMAGLDGAGRLAHAVEDFLSGLRDGSLTPNPDLIDASLAAVDDIDAILDEWREGDEIKTDPESTVSTFRSEMQRYRDQPGTNDPMSAQDADPESISDPPTDEFDQTVVDALESASGFDDLEGLLADMDDPDEESADEQSRWGTFDQRGAGPRDEPHASADVPDGQDGPPEALGPSSGPMDDFDAIKSGVETDDVSSLDDELVETEFGEFDDDDELSIQDLIEGEVAGPDVVEEDADHQSDSAADDDQSVDSSATTATDSRNDAIHPEDFGYEPAATSDSDAESVSGTGQTADEHAPDQVSDEPAGVTADSSEAANPFEGADVVDPDEPVADEGEVTASGVRDDTEISFPDGKTFGPGGEESSVDDDPAPGVTADEGSTTQSDDEFVGQPDAAFTEQPDDEPASPAESGDGELDLSEEFADDGLDLPDEFSDDDLSFDEDDDADAFSDDDLGLSEVLGEDDLSEGFVDHDIGVSDDHGGEITEGEPDEFDDGLDLPEDFLSGGIELDDDGRATTDVSESQADTDLSVEPGAADVDLPDIDLPDVDELSGESLAGEFDGDSVADVSFERDEHTMAFESRFAERFGGSVGDDKVQLVQVASATIEESSLDAARYQSSGTASYPPDFGETRESDEIQSLTVDVQNADSLLNLVEELSLTQLRIKQSDGEDIDDHLSVMDSVTSELRRTVMNLRLMPLSTVTDGLPRVVRDIARAQDKRVAFDVSDEGVDLDRSIVEKLGDPLVHLVRNAVDHGIESPDERVQQGKPREGTIELRAWRDRERVVIEVEDDGRGISAERVRQQAIDRDIVSRERAERLSLDEVYDLVFEPGFSTTDEVTDVSGRGVGMDAVRRTVNSLDGTVDLKSEPGSGTTVRVRLPVSVAVAKMLFVDVGPEQYAIPASVVDDVEVVDETDLPGDGTVAIEWPDHVADYPEHIPLLRLGEELGVEDETDGAADRGDTDDGEPGAGKRVLVRLAPETRNAALLCDGVDDAREVVVKPYEKLLGDVPGISGATMSGDGTLVNIVDVTTL